MSALLEGIRIALQAIWAQKLRSSLTLLCVIISILSIIAVVSVLDGMDAYVRDEIAEAGTNVFQVQRRDDFTFLTDFDAFVDSLSNPRILLADAAMLRREMKLAAHVDPSERVRATFVAGDRSLSGVTVLGRSEEYPGVEQWELDHGRHLARADVDQRKAVCVLGSKIAEELFPDLDPEGRKVRIEGMHYEVVGVFRKRPNVLGEDRNTFAVIPITNLYSRWGAQRNLDAIKIKARSLETFPQALEEAEILMRIRRGLRPGEKNNFHLQTAEQFVSLWESLSRALFASLTGIVGITLVIGGIIIMNVMLISVNERTREVGLRKALGAKNRTILFQFLVEAVTLTSTGGIAGIVLGFLVASSVAALTPLPYAIEPWSIAVALLVVFAVGIFFGLYPASRAARLHPVDALHYE